MIRWTFEEVRVLYKRAEDAEKVVSAAELFLAHCYPCAGTGRLAADFNIDGTELPPECACAPLRKAVAFWSSKNRRTVEHTKPFPCSNCKVALDDIHALSSGELALLRGMIGTACATCGMIRLTAEQFAKAKRP